MCYDQEKTQGALAAETLRANKALNEEMRARKGRFDTMETAGCEERRPMSESDVLAELFKYHPPTNETLPKFSAINQAAKNFAEIILANCPPSADRSAAIRLIRDARMTANASVALNGLSL